MATTMFHERCVYRPRVFIAAFTKSSEKSESEGLIEYTDELNPYIIYYYGEEGFYCKAMIGIDEDIDCVSLIRCELSFEQITLVNRFTGVNHHTTLNPLLRHYVQGKVDPAETMARRNNAGIRNI